MANGLSASTKVAYVFPGQGSQTVGMGRELYDTSPAVRALFEAADDILGFPLSRLCFEGPEEELRRTINAQPAIMAVSLASLEAAQQQGIPSPPLFMAGHSLGEYTALVAAGALDFAHGLRLVRERGRLMEEAGRLRPGGMAAVIGLDETSVEEVCRETGTQIANQNSPDQIVISGPQDALARALDMARALGAKRVIPLEVSGAFHSSLMEPAAQGMAHIITHLPFHDARIPIIANSTAQPLTSAEKLKDELLQQLCHCVQWQRSIEYMVGCGVSAFFEIGPGRVLSGLIKRVSREVQVFPVAELPGLKGGGG